VFFAYCGVLYLLKWDPFWKWMLSLGFENRNNAEGFLILASTTVWLVATLRIILFGVRSRALGVGSGELRSRVPRQERLRLTTMLLIAPGPVCESRRALPHRPAALRSSKRSSRDGGPALHALPSRSLNRSAILTSSAIDFARILRITWRR